MSPRTWPKSFFFKKILFLERKKNRVSLTDIIKNSIKLNHTLGCHFRNNGEKKNPQREKGGNWGNSLGERKESGGVRGESTVKQSVTVVLSYFCQLWITTWSVTSVSGPDQVQIRSVLVLVSQVKTVTQRQTSGENRVKGQDTLEGTVVKTNLGGVRVTRGMNQDFQTNYELVQYSRKHFRFKASFLGQEFNSESLINY